MEWIIVGLLAGILFVLIALGNSLEHKLNTEAEKLSEDKLDTIAEKLSELTEELQWHKRGTFAHKLGEWIESQQTGTGEYFDSELSPATSGWWAEKEAKTSAQHEFHAIAQIPPDGRQAASLYEQGLTFRQIALQLCPQRSDRGHQCGRRCARRVRQAAERYLSASRPSEQQQ